MLKLYRSLLACLLISFYANQITLIPALGMEQGKRVSVEANTPSGDFYDGARCTETIENVRVSTCISLGGGCIDKINHVIKNADQFIVSLMYRFDSPVIMRTLEDKYINSRIEGRPMDVAVFLDYYQAYKNPLEGSQYYNSIRRLIDSVPTSLVKMRDRAFHHKVTVSKKTKEQAVTILGSANATFEADNMHSEDIVLVQSNHVAKFFLEEFERFLESKPLARSSSAPSESPLQVFDEHRANYGENNTRVLSRAKECLEDSDSLTMEEWHKGDIVSLAISTGFAGIEGRLKCLNVVNEALGNAANEGLLLFENYMSLSEELKKNEIWTHLKNPTPKFIVLDNNKSNRGEEKKEETEKEEEKFEGVQSLKEGINNEVLLFSPYTNKKFHHKLIMQYILSGIPIIYTGSFHISTNAITKNSEDIIGVRCYELADDYLSSILLNSGLGEQVEFWSFIEKYPYLLRKKQSDSLVLQAAQQLLLKSQINMKRYREKLELLKIVIKEAASAREGKEKIKNCFDRCLESFEHEGEYNLIQEAIEELYGEIFENEEVYPIWIGYLNKEIENIVKISKAKEEYALVQDLILEDPRKCLDELKDWLTSAEDAYKSEQVNMKLIEQIYHALNDLKEYDITCTKIYELHDKLSIIINIK